MLRQELSSTDNDSNCVITVPPHEAWWPSPYLPTSTDAESNTNNMKEYTLTTAATPDNNWPGIFDEPTDTGSGEVNAKATGIDLALPFYCYGKLMDFSNSSCRRSSDAGCPDQHGMELYQLRHTPLA